MSFDIGKAREIWERIAEAWDRNRAIVARFMRPATEHLVGLVDAQPGETILEVGTGQGETGFLIAEQLGAAGRLVCTDLSPAMLEHARAAAERLGLTNVEFHEMNAQELAFSDESFDAIVGRLVYHLLPDPGRAFTEARRVLRPGGRLCFTVFGPAEHMRFEGAIRETMALRDLSLPPGLSFDVDLSDAAAMRELLDRAGFTDVEVKEIPLVIDFANGDDMWRYISEMIGRQTELIRSLAPDEQAAFRDTLLEQLEPYRDGDGSLAIPALAVNVRAR